jgi:hypothetical protein
LSVVKTDDLNETIAEAGKVTSLTNEVTTLKSSVEAETAKVTALTAEVANLKKAAGKPAEEPTGPVAVNADGTPAVVVAVDNFETSFDREVKAAKG